MLDRDDLIQRWIAKNSTFAKTAAETYDADGNYIETPGERLDAIVHDAPEIAWPLILDILKEASTNEAYALLAAGPLEDLLADHGEAFIERIEIEARRNSKFRELLGGVWQNSMTTTIWNRVQKARGNIIW